MESDLPCAVAVDPDGASLGLMDDLAGGVLARGAVGYEYDFGCEGADDEVAEMRCLM